MKTWAVAGEWPLSMDDNDGVAGFGDMLSLDEGVWWEPISSFGPQFGNNWNIRVVLTSDTVNQSIFLGYRVYNNGEKINAEHITDTSFIVPAEFVHDYNRFAVTTNYISCESDSAIMIFFPTEIPENIQTGVKIFPNPTHGKTMIQSIRPLISVNVYNVSGQLAKTFTLIGNSVEIDLGGLQPACYILHIETKDGTPLNRMLILQ
ncbi:MAG: T9SS type A sorting domain-containing protein [Bacteroidota bacterium]